MAKKILEKGDKVKFKDGDPTTYIVYEVYKAGVSLALPDYSDVEQDQIVSFSQLTKV